MYNRTRQVILADHIPSKQGLRRFVFRVSTRTIELADHIPLKQGLRRCDIYADRNSYSPRRPYSIKTRIKTSRAPGSESPQRGLADHIPLKQGLRLQTFGLSE